MDKNLTTYQATETALYTSSDMSKVEMYNLVNGDATPVSEIIGEAITLNAVYFEPITYTDKTGEVVEGVRIVICDEFGQTYTSLSATLRNALVRLLTVFDGVPEGGIKIIINKVTKDGKTYYSITAK